MKIVLLESLGISQELLDSYVKPLTEKGHEFAAYERNDDVVFKSKKRKMPISSSLPICLLRQRSSTPARI